MTDPNRTYGFDAEITHSVRQAFHDGFAALPGRQVRTVLPYSPGDAPWLDSPLHPVFPLAEHFRSNDDGNRGYTENGHRGDHLSVPCWSEYGDAPSILEISFHKGHTAVEHVTHPEAANTPESEALIELLQHYETR